MFVEHKFWAEFCSNPKRLWDFRKNRNTICKVCKKSVSITSPMKMRMILQICSQTTSFLFTMVNRVRNKCFVKEGGEKQFF